MLTLRVQLTAQEIVVCFLPSFLLTLICPRKQEAVCGPIAEGK